MKFQLKGNLQIWCGYLLIILIAMGCKKQNDVISPNLNKPSSLTITIVNKKDVNKFVITFKIKTDAAFFFDNYGIVIAKDSIKNLEGHKLYSFGDLKSVNEKIDSCVLDSLEGYSTYHLKVFAKHGAVTYLSTDKTIYVEGLKITGIGGTTMKTPHASRGAWLNIYSNFNQSADNLKQTKVKIGGIEATLVSLNQNVVTIIVPESLTAGKKSIEIQRNGLSVMTSDTLDILKGTYKKLNDFPYQYRSLYGACQIGNVGYMIGGSIYANSGPTGWYNDLLTYNITDDKWSTSNYQNYPTQYILDYETFVVNNKIYAIPGRDTSVNTTAFPSTGRVFEFDPAINKWSEKSSFPGVKRFVSAGFVVSNQIFVFGGNANGPQTDLWQYTPATDKWVQKANFPGTSVIYPCIFNFGTKVYVFGGYMPQALVVNDFWEYDVQNDGWNQMPSNDKIHARFRSVYFTLLNKGYMLGGTYMDYDAFGQGEYQLSDSWEFDFETKKWSQISDYSTPAMPYNFTSFYAKPFTFLKENTAIIYDKGKMFQFTAN